MGFVATIPDGLPVCFAPQEREKFLAMSVCIGSAAMTVAYALDRGYMRWNHRTNAPEFNPRAINQRFGT